MNREPPDRIKDICHYFSNHLQNILGEKLHGIYIFGGASSSDSFPKGDIDFHVILSGELTEEEKKLINEMHEDIEEKFPPLGIGMDGYYILLEDACRKSPPRSQMWENAVDKSWALHCEHIRGGHCIVVYGPNPLEIYPEMSWSEIEKALDVEMNYVKKYLEEYPHYSILNLCRLAYSYQAGDVVISKGEAADWALENFPEWKKLIELSIKTYSGDATETDRKYLLSEVENFMKFSVKRIDEINANSNNQK